MSGTEKKRELTDMQKKFIEALFTAESKGKPHIAKKMAGYSDSVQTGELIQSLHEEIVEYAKKFMATHSPAAVLAMFDILDEPTSAGAMTKLKAATEVLNRVGVTKQEDNGIKLPESGLVILPSKKINIEVEVEG